jgi:hypothetical protein
MPGKNGTGQFFQAKIQMFKIQNKSPKLFAAVVFVLVI